MALPKWAILAGVAGALGVGYYIYKRKKKAAAEAAADASSAPAGAVPATGNTACQRTAAAINRSRGLALRLKPAWVTQCRNNGGKVIYTRTSRGNQQVCVCP